MDDWRVRKDGSEFLAHIAITALKNPDGTVRGFAIVVRDITDQRAAESALRNSESHLRSILRSEEHTSELQSLMRISYAVFCLKKKPSTIQCLRDRTAAAARPASTTIYHYAATPPPTIHN